MWKQKTVWWAVAVLGILPAPVAATVQIASVHQSLASPQPVGNKVTWTIVATDSNAGPVAFQFNVAPPGGQFFTMRQFNAGTAKTGGWVSLPFQLALTGTAGKYQIQVVAKDFSTGESVSRTVLFVATPPGTGGSPTVQATQNPLVALFTAPPCATGSTQRVSFQPVSALVPATTTNWLACRPGLGLSFEIAGMYPSTDYTLFAQVETGGQIVDGPAVGFTTGPLPANIPFPVFQPLVAANPGDPEPVILHTLFDLQQGITYPNVATDLAGNIVWYNYGQDVGHTSTITRPLPNGYIATQNGIGWQKGVVTLQFLRQLDWAGNVIRETNIGILARQLQALGNPDAQSCDQVPSLPPVGTACIGVFHHDAIQTLPNGYTAALIDVEKIFPPGTQGDTSGLPVDVVGDMIVVLDQNWNAVWYWDAFDPLDGGNGYAALPVSRTAVLDESCAVGCLAVFLDRPGISPVVRDWLHCNSLYYWPHDGAPAPSTAPGDLLLSSRHQDWVMKIDYQDGAGTGNIDWRMGPSGDFEFVNAYNDPWPWFSHQHDAGIEGGGAGVFDVMDNGNTRVSPSAGPGSSTGGVPGLGTDCAPADCDTRGMALTLDEADMQVAPVLSVDLGVYSDAMGSAQLLDDGNYFFLAATVLTGNQDSGYRIEIEPAEDTGSGTQVLNLEGPGSYRAWQIPNLYTPPAT